MVQTLEAIRGGGGSVKVGTTGTISALMSREIESAKAAAKLPSPNTTVSNSANDSPPRKLKSKTSLNEPGSSNAKNDKCPETVRKTKHHTGRTNRIPMLAADNMSVDGTPSEEAWVLEAIRHHGLIRLLQPLEIGFQIPVSDSRKGAWLINIVFCNFHHRTHFWYEPLLSSHRLFPRDGNN